MGEISVKTGNNARNGGKNSLNRLIRCVCGKKSAQIREILISESAWEEMTCLFAPSLEQSFFQYSLANENGNSQRARLKIGPLAWNTSSVNALGILLLFISNPYIAAKNK
ncbi:hypothetical protein P5G70_03145 [Serratia nevei]|nr:hypothetical protein [Serratia nevei]